MKSKETPSKVQSYESTELDALEEAINIPLYQLLCPDHIRTVLQLLWSSNEWNTWVVLLHPEPLQHLNHSVGFGSTHYKELLAVICFIIVDFHLQAFPPTSLIVCGVDPQWCRPHRVCKQWPAPRGSSTDSWCLLGCDSGTAGFATRGLQWLLDPVGTLH